MRHWIRSIAIIGLAVAMTYVASEWAVRQKPVTPRGNVDVDRMLAAVEKMQAELTRQAELIAEARQP